MSFYSTIFKDLHSTSFSPLSSTKEETLKVVEYMWIRDNHSDYLLRLLMPIFMPTELEKIDLLPRPSSIHVMIKLVFPINAIVTSIPIALSTNVPDALSENLAMLLVLVLFIVTPSCLSYPPFVVPLDCLPDDATSPFSLVSLAMLYLSLLLLINSPPQIMMTMVTTLTVLFQT